ncbi:MAG TPA: hypothetical protein VG889_17655 [Rhizomicrobium sp.]|nr:hypothetical protein [Rhizomicrobium sp.]
MTHKLVAVLVAAGTACLAGCGTITQGTSQDIAISSTPPGAHCELTKQNGIHVATLDRTPGKVHVQKTKHDLTLTCDLQGYQTATANLKSGYGIGTFGNIILGGGIGWAIDSASGADNKYPESAAVTFVPEGQAAPAAPAAPAAAPTASSPSS